MLYIPLTAGVAMLAFIVGIYFYLGYRAQKREWKQKLATWYPEEKRKSFIVGLGDKYDKTDRAKVLAEKLHNANLILTPSEYLGFHLLGFLGLVLVFTNMFKIPFPLSVIIPILILLGAHSGLFMVRKNKYEERFNDQLADICRLLGNAARSGMTLTQGIDLVAKETPAPAGKEFKRISQELKLGVPLEYALRSIQKQNKSRDFQLFIATLLIQKKTGGNLAAILESMSNTLEDRKILNQSIKTMTAEQKYISFIVPAMPVFLVLIMNASVDGFVDPLWTGPGIVLLVLFAAGVVLSFFLIRKITNIKV
ncbi:hypothetical protein F7984_01680 [Pradoshia sp. D12]|nr:hypothetical protein A8L44_16295 [Bacillus sp. FJAT-27986]QFK73165.1 hypothetical protein F7984_01680 [Pradoshia sp. D12]TPF70651.1 hypothetical protein FHY44_16815 [Bacillus sp. D12]